VDVVFVGDRYLTDVVFGNRHGMLTVRVAPLTSQGEPPGVVAARRIEEWCVARWVAGGIKAPPHARLPGARVLEAVAEDVPPRVGMQQQQQQQHGGGAER
jgi:phosphatidylglycerophosphatase GEP4